MLSNLIRDVSVLMCINCALVGTIKKWLNQHARCNSEKKKSISPISSALIFVAGASLAAGLLNSESLA